MSQYHDFQKSLQWAEGQSDTSQLNRFYRSRFPDVKEVIKVGDNLKLQRQGIDTIVVLETGKRIYFDEKIRKKDWGDFFLEEYSVWKNYPEITPPRHSGLNPITINWKEPVPEQYEKFLKRGWIHGEKITDYIAYIIPSANTGYLLPFFLLQRAWDKHYLGWLQKHGRKSVPNRGYYTTGIPVPKDILYKALYKKADWKGNQ